MKTAAPAATSSHSAAAHLGAAGDTDTADAGGPAGERALAATAAIVQLASEQSAGDAAPAAAGVDPVQRARAFAEPLLSGQLLDSGEGVLAHADGTAAVLRAIGAAPGLCAAVYLVYAGDHLQRPEDTLRKAFGDGDAGLVMLTRKLVQIQRAARARGPAAVEPRQSQRALQTERVRKMLLAFSRDLRVVLLRLASRLQTLRWFAAARQACPPELATESLQVFAPLASRLGIWQIKWELEDRAFRTLQPQDYQQVARLVDEKRAERELGMQAARAELETLLRMAGVQADVQGRPKHLYSIWKKMQGKGLAFSRVFDTRALRVVVRDKARDKAGDKAGDTAECYTALACVHQAWEPLDGEFDDYIARPKANGYQSLHTVVRGSDGRPLEVQIRTQAMHAHAEHGVAAHWMYKEAGVRGYGGVSAAGDLRERLAEARKAVLRELLAWERDFADSGVGDGSPIHGSGQTADADAGADERVYVFTPQATVIDLPAGGTAVDFAYSLHTDLGHRCRGARVDGTMLPLNTPLRSGQTVEIVSAKEGGPSLDWLNPELHYLASPRAKAKVRAWFNAEQQSQTIARGRDAVEKLLQREGRTALERQALAEQLGFRTAEALFEVVGKDAYSLRNIENLLRPAEPAAGSDTPRLHRPSSELDGRGGVLVVGIDSLLTTLARCCRPVPPDAISGFVTRGRGVAVHRHDCSNLRHMAQTSPGRVIDVAWGTPEAGKPPVKGSGDNSSRQGDRIGARPGARHDQRQAVYPLDMLVEAADRPGLLRDISEALAKEKMNVTDVHTQLTKDRGTAWLTLTVELSDLARLPPVLAQITRLAGVRHARRK